MSLQGSHRGLLDELHVQGCDGREFATCRPVPNLYQLVTKGPDETPFWVICMEWCAECGAADWEYVGR